MSEINKKCMNSVLYVVVRNKTFILIYKYKVWISYAWILAWANLFKQNV